MCDGPPLGLPHLPPPKPRPRQPPLFLGVPASDPVSRDSNSSAATRRLDPRLAGLPRFRGLNIRPGLGVERREAASDSAAGVA